MDTLFSFRYMRILVAILLGMIILAVFGVIAQTLNWSWTEPNYATINVEGYAEVTAVPDIGVFNFTVEAENMEVAVAQEESGNKINEIMTFLKTEGGVEEKDIKTTGYNTYPRYEWEASQLCTTPNCDSGRERVLRGYVVTQTVTVKVRETSKAGELIAGVGSRGATNMSGLSFEVDDLEGKKEEARLLATADAKEKAKRLAEELDVRLGDVVNFHDGSDGGGYYPMPMMAESRAVSMDDAGYGGAMEEKAFAPEISVGEDEIVARVTITYKIK